MLEHTIILGLMGSLCAGLATGIGALGIFAVRRVDGITETLLLSAAAGVMLAATFFSLLLPGIEYARTLFESPSMSVLIVIGGLLMGALVLSGIHRFAPHEHFIIGHEGPDSGRLGRIWLFVIAITLHNFPEGMAVGTGFAGGDRANGFALATGIGLQNIPEGLAVAGSLLAVNYSKGRAFWLAFLTGLVEPVGGLVGSLAVSVALPLMPWALGFAAGAMLFVISDEIIPETHRDRDKGYATWALVGGFCVMMYLDATLG